MCTSFNLKARVVQPNWTNSGDNRSLLVYRCLEKKLNHYECVEGQHTEERREIK